MHCIHAPRGGGSWTSLPTGVGGHDPSHTNHFWWDERFAVGPFFPSQKILVIPMLFWPLEEGSFRHKDGPKQGAISCRQGEDAWKLWKLAPMEMCHCQMGLLSMQKLMRTSKVLSRPSRKMLIRSMPVGSRRLATQVSLQCRQQPLLGRKSCFCRIRRSHFIVTWSGCV